jgi:DNA-binding transcriptional LysR family regulator
LAYAVAGPSTSTGYAVRAELTDQRLVRVLEPYCPSFPGYYLYYSSRTHLAPKLRALVEFLRWRGARRRGAAR